MDANLNQFLDNEWQLLQVLGDFSSSSFGQAQESTAVNPLDVRYQDANTDSFSNGYLKDQSLWKQTEPQNRLQQHSAQQQHHSSQQQHHSSQQQQHSSQQQQHSAQQQNAVQHSVQNGHGDLGQYGGSPNVQSSHVRPETNKLPNRQAGQNGFDYLSNHQKSDARPVQSQFGQSQRTLNKYQTASNFETSTMLQQRAPDQSASYSPQHQYTRPQNEHFLNQQYASRLESATQALNPARSSFDHSMSNQLPHFNSFRQSNYTKPVARLEQVSQNQQVSQNPQSELPAMSDISKIQQIQNWLQSSNPDDSLSQAHNSEPMYAKVNMAQTNSRLPTQQQVPELTTRHSKPQQPKVSVNDVINQFKLERSNQRTSGGMMYQSGAYDGGNQRISEVRANKSFDSGSILSGGNNSDVQMRQSTGHTQMQRHHKYQPQFQDSQMKNYKHAENPIRTQESLVRPEKNFTDNQKQMENYGVNERNLGRSDQRRVQNSFQQVRNPTALPVRSLEIRDQLVQPTSSRGGPLSNPSMGVGPGPPASPQPLNKKVVEPGSAIESRFGLKNAVVYGQEPFKVPEYPKSQDSTLVSDERRFTPVRQQLPTSMQPPSGFHGANAAQKHGEGYLKKSEPPPYQRQMPSSPLNQLGAMTSSAFGVQSPSAPKQLNSHQQFQDQFQSPQAIYQHQNQHRQNSHSGLEERVTPLTQLQQNPDRQVSRSSSGSATSRDSPLDLLGLNPQSKAKQKSRSQSLKTPDGRLPPTGDMFGTPLSRNPSRPVSQFSSAVALERGTSIDLSNHKRTSSASVPSTPPSGMDPLGSLDLSRIPQQSQGLDFSLRKGTQGKTATGGKLHQEILNDLSTSMMSRLSESESETTSSLDLRKHIGSPGSDRKGPKGPKKSSHTKLMVTEPPTQFGEELDLQINFMESHVSQNYGGSVPILIKENPQLKVEKSKDPPKSFVQLYPNMVFQSDGDAEFVVEKIEKVGNCATRDVKEEHGMYKSDNVKPLNAELGTRTFTSFSSSSAPYLHNAPEQPLRELTPEPPRSRTPAPLDPEIPWDLTCIVTRRIFRPRSVIKNVSRALAPNDKYWGAPEKKPNVPVFPCKKKCCVPLAKDSYENHKKMYMHLILATPKVPQASKAHNHNSTAPMKMVLSLRPLEPESRTPLPAHIHSSGKPQFKQKDTRGPKIPGSAPRGRPRKPENLNKSPDKPKRVRKSSNVSLNTPVAQAALGLLNLTPSLVGSPSLTLDATPAHSSFSSPAHPLPLPYKFKTKAELKEVREGDVKPPVDMSTPSHSGNLPRDICSPSVSIQDLRSPLELMSPDSFKKKKKQPKKIPELLVAIESEKYGEECAISIIENKNYVPPPTPPPTQSGTPPPTQSDTPPPVIEKHDVWDDMFSHSLENFCSELGHTGVKRVKRTEVKDSLPPVLEANLPQTRMPLSPSSGEDEELPLTARLKSKKPPKRKAESDEEDSKRSKPEPFYSGWEGELVEFKKTLRMPSQLISVPQTIPGEGIKIKIKKRFLFKQEKLKRFKKKFSSGASGFDYLKKKKKKLVIRDRQTDDRALTASTAGTSSSAAVRAPPLDVGIKLKEFSMNKSIGETLLHKVARVGYLEGVAYLLSKSDADPSIKDNAGYTPLHEACGKGHLPVAHLLLMCGADVSASAQGGIRPLHEASEFGSLQLVRLLIAYGADPTLGTYNGVTPFQLTSSKAIKTLLTSHLQDVDGKPVLEWDVDGLPADHCSYDVMEEAPGRQPTKYTFEISDNPLPQTSYCTTARERHALLNDVADLSGNPVNSLRKRLEARTVRKDEFYFKYTPDTVGAIPEFGDSTGFVEYDSDLKECLGVVSLTLD